MIVEVNVQPGKIGYIMVNKTEEAPAVIPPKDSSVSLTHLADAEEPMTFNYVNGTVNQTFVFDLMYYQASQGKDGYKDSSNCAEGAYLLKPDRFHRW